MSKYFSVDLLKCLIKRRSKAIFAPLRRSIPYFSLLVTISLLSLLTSCGGGDSGGDTVASTEGSGIGGSGFVSTGAIDQFGSIFVNGVKFDIDDAEIANDGAFFQGAPLELGMYVRVVGNVGANGETYIASSVEYETNLQGPVREVTLSQGRIYKIATVLNKTVLVHPIDTVYANTSYATIENVDWIEVSGKVLDANTIIASRVVGFGAEPSDQVILRSRVTAIAEVQYSLTGDFIATRTGDIPDLSITVGDIVEVTGTINGNVITSTRIEKKENFDPFDPVEPTIGIDTVVEGEVSNFVSLSQFDVAGVAIVNQAATISPNVFSIANGLTVRVSGEYQSEGLRATQILVQEIVEEGTVTQVDLDSNTLQVQINTLDSELSFTLNSETRIYDQTNDDVTIALSDINVGDQFLLNLNHDTASELLATELVRIAQFTGSSSYDPAATGANTPLNVTNSHYQTDSSTSVYQYNQTAGGTLNLVLDSKIPGEYGRIIADEGINLGGTLQVTLSNIEVAEGDLFDLFEGNISGSFDNIELPTLTGDLLWNTINIEKNGELLVQSANQPMKITVDTSLDNQVQLRFFDTVSNVTIDWGDGSIEQINSEGEVSHTYATVGEFTINVSGNFTGFGWGDFFLEVTPEIKAITGVTQWNLVNGQHTLISLAGAFRENYNLVQVPSYLPPTVTSTSYMFALNPLLANHSVFNQNLSHWNLSKVTDISYMFGGANSFNQPVGDWDVSNVTNMSGTFGFASSFNQDISRWDVSNVTDMKTMFTEAHRFNQDIGSWNVSNVTNMNNLFHRAYRFNQNISAWTVSKVANMQGMFFEAFAFNQDISAWDVSRVTNMSNMFENAAQFNQDISDWNIASVVNMTAMFNGIALSTSHYDALLIGWNALNLQPDVIFDGGNSRYSAGGNAETARSNMINSDGWTINDGGAD